MIRFVAACLVIWAESCSGTFFHRFSIKSLEQAIPSFGYSLDYQQQKRSLVVGAPLADLDGSVSSCDVPSWNCSTIMGSHQLIDKWGKCSRDDSPEQHFGLGASVAVAPDYVFACAPSQTGYVDYADSRGKVTKQFKTIGTCFIKGDKVLQRYNATIDHDTLEGAVGWSVVVDAENDIIIMSKPVHGSIMYTSVKNPMQRTVNVTNWSKVVDFTSIGRALTKCVFLRGYKTVYAFSMDQPSRRGAIAFLHYDKTKYNMLQIVVAKGDRMVMIKRKEEYGTLFGSVLSAADFNMDGYSELLVGAPTQSYKNIYETGAVYIYLGGEKTSARNWKNLRINHDKPGSRFGTAVAAADLDDDNLPDLFVSAPYEDESGAIYVISGYRVKELLERRDKKEYFIAEECNQRISESSKSFGFALQPLPNFAENAANGLAVGSPSTSTITIYRSIPAVNVTISAHLKDKEVVRELDANFTISITVSVNHTRHKITGKLIVEINIIEGIGATIKNEDRTFAIDLSISEGNITKDITINLDDEDPRTYKFLASVKADESLFNNKEYSESLVRLSEYSVNKHVLSVHRRCRGEECVPRLQILKVDWMNGLSQYVLGSSRYEIITVFIKNGGVSSYESCAKITVAGAKMTSWDCYPADISDTRQELKCKFAVIEGYKVSTLNIHLDMSETSNKDERLELAVSLYNKCSSGQSSDNSTKTIPYELKTSDISITGSPLGQNVTDREVAESNKTTVDIQDQFIITNNGSVNWKDVIATVLLSREPYVQDFTIKIYPEQIEKSTTATIKIDEAVFLAHSFSLNLDRGTAVKIITTANILKDKIGQFEKLQLSYELQLHLLPTPEVKAFSLNSSRVCVKDAQVGTNKTYIIIIAIVAAIIVLFVLGAILYKFGFFKRTAKEELKNLREEARQRSFRPPYYLIEDEPTSSSEPQQPRKDTGKRCSKQQDERIATR